MRSTKLKSQVLIYSARDKNTFVTVSNYEFYDSLLRDSEDGETNWTISKNARRGDRVLLYICAPIQAVVAVATLAADPEMELDPSADWYGYYLADMDCLYMLKEPLTRHRLVSLFPDWGFWRQPRTYTLVRKQYLPELEDLIKK